MSIGDAISVGSTIYGILSPPIFRQCGYILFCKTHVSDLKSEIQKLKDAAARLQHSVDESRSAGEFIHQDILTWLNNADQRIESGNRILEINKIGRVLGCVPDPKACHKLGRDAKKAIPDFQKLFSEGVFDKVSYNRVEEQSLIVGASTSSQRNYVALKSRTAVLKFVMEALDDDKIDAIGVYGMGGVGKTTLLKEVENEAKESKKFDGVVSVFVSQTPNLNPICAEIDYRLKRLVKSDASRKTVLIIFDDLWKPLDLKKLGVPESNSKLKVKLVMASRNKHLLADEMSCQRTFSIGVLDVEEAWRFFAVLVSSKIQDLKGKPVAVVFLKKCAGICMADFQFSIEALATLWKKKKMYSSSGDLSEDDLKQANESPDGFVSLELSYNSLEDGDEENQAKLVFRIIGLLNSPKVLVLTLIKYMVGLGLFGSRTSYNIVERVRMEITRSLRILQESSLLLESDDSDHVKIHDVVRDVAVGIASREDHALIFDPLKSVNEWSVEKLKECKSAYLTSSVVKELHEGWNSPLLNIFVLEADAEEGDHRVELPDAKDMVKLRVMHFKNAKFTLLPSSINPDLQNLTTLCFDNCCLEDIAIIGKLITLQVLSLTGCDLAKLPEEIGELTNLRMLDLSNCSQLVFIKPGILERLTQLEDLNLRESFDKWEIEGDTNGEKHNASLEELNSMPRLRTLQVCIPDISKLPQNLPLENLVQSKVLMGESWDWSDEYNESRTLKLEVKLDSMIDEEWFQYALQKTQDLHLKGLNETTESFHELCREGFEELKHLHLQNSSSIKCIIWSTEWLECISFMALESMILMKMGSLEKICDGRIDPSSFSKLKVVRVHECHKLKSIFNFSLLKNLTELEEIEISDCKMLQQIVIAEQINDIEDATDEEQHTVGMIGGCSNIFFGRSAKRLTDNTEDGGADDEIKKLLGNLRYLTLTNLPEITSFFTTEGRPRDESIETTLAPVFLNDQKASQPPRYEEIQSVSRLRFDKLQRIELTKCKSLVYFTNSQVLLKLVNLESLTITRCESLEYIFDLQGIEPDNENVEILPKLYELKLRELRKLEHIWKKNPRQQTKGCRKLRTLEISKCDNLLYVSSSFMCEVMENLTEINLGYCLNMYSVFLEEEGLGNNASSIKASLTSLKILAISYCPNMKAFLSDLSDEFSTNSECDNDEMAYCCYGKKAADTSANTNSFFSQKVFLPSLESLILSSVCGGFKKLWCEDIPDHSYCKLKYLHVTSCPNLLAVIPASLIERLDNLIQLWVVFCVNLEVVFDIDVGWKAKNKSKALMLPQLQEVKLTNLQCLRHVIDRSSDDDEIVVGFPGLNVIQVSECKKLINLISTTTATTLLELKSLSISRCSELPEVISGEVSDHRYKRDAITFPHLTSLALSYLGNLTCFSSESRRFDFGCLKILNIYGCSSLKKFIMPRSDGRLGSQHEANTATQVLFNEKIQVPNLEELHISNSGLIEELWNKQPTGGSFCKLKVLEISEFSSLQSVVPSFMVNRLQNMERLCILSCELLQDIFKFTSSTKQIQSSHDSKIFEERIAEESIGESSMHTPGIRIILFSKLSYLQLKGNIQLSNLCSGNYTLEMPSLKTLFLSKTNASAVEAIMKKVHLPNLEQFYVFSLQEMTSLWHVEQHVGSFSKLKRILVEACEGLVKIIPFFMLKRLQNLERLVVRNCNNIETVCEVKWWIDHQVQDSESNELLPCFPFQKLAYIHVEKSESLRSLFSISGQHLGETPVSCKVVQLPQLKYLRLGDLPNFSHLLFQQGQYTLEFSSLEEFFLIGAGDKETVTHKVAFPKKLEIQVSNELSNNFFGSTTGVVTNIMKALQTNQFIIGLLGNMGNELAAELEEQVIMKEANLFDQVVICTGGVASVIQGELGRQLGIVYGEADVQIRAERVCKTLLTCIRSKRLLLILTRVVEDGILEAAGIPVDGRGVDPKYFKIILVSNKKELLLKMGTKPPPITIGHDVGGRRGIFVRELRNISKEFPTLLELGEKLGAIDINTDNDICSFLGPNHVLFNNIMRALFSRNQIIGMRGSLNYLRELLFIDTCQLEDLFHELVVPDDNEVGTIQKKMETSLGITTSCSCKTADGLLHENKAQCIRQALISTSSTLDKKRLLLVLSDLDKEVDLEAVGIPIDELDPIFFKILLMSEKTQVLQKMGAQQVIERGSEPLKRTLFWRVVDGSVGNPELSKLADECGSDDLAYLLAKKLKRQGMHAWAKAFRRLKESPFVYEERRKVIASLY